MKNVILFALIAIAQIQALKKGELRQSEVSECFIFFNMPDYVYV